MSPATNQSTHGEAETDIERAQQLIPVLQGIAFGMVSGMSMMFPARSPVVADLMPGVDMAIVGQTVAKMAAAGGFAEFVVNPMFGKYSDLVGRKPVFMTTLAVSAASRLLAFVNRDKLGFIFLEKVATTAADTALMTQLRASLTDVIRGDQFSLMAPKIAAAAGLGVISGPAISLAIQKATGSLSVLYLVSGTISLLNLVHVARNFTETLDESQRRPFTLRAANPFSFLEMMSTSLSMTKLMCVSLLQTAIDGRNMADTDFAFLSGELDYTNEQTSKSVMLAGLKVFFGGILGPVILKKVGTANITTFANTVNALTALSVAAFPFHIQALSMVTVLSERKRDGVENMATELAIRHGYGRGQIAASLMNFRALTSIFAPIIFSTAFARSVARKKRTGSTSPAIDYFLVAAMISVLAEAVYRTLSKDELERIRRKPQEGPSSTAAGKP